MKFWDKVADCKHENISKTYSDFGSCVTPYCQWSERRCADCKVYIVTCGCNYYSGMSGHNLRYMLAM